MNKRIAKKLRTEMLSWTKDSVVRHSNAMFRRAWKFEVREIKAAVKR